MSDNGGDRDQRQGQKKGNYQYRQRRGNQGNQRTDQKKKNPEDIPILKYGPNNNFFQHKERLSNAALKLYGPLGKLIKLGKYYLPDEPDVDDYGLDEGDPYGLKKANYLEDMKEYRKETLRMKNDRPKLYALILQYLSEESLDEVKRQDKFDEYDEATDPEGLWKLVEETHKVNSVSKVEAVTKMSARNAYQVIRQGHYESIISYKEQFSNALKAYNDQKNPAMEDEDIAMDFFRGLDNGRYASFKAEIINGLTAGAFQQPKDLNSMYLKANQWLKTSRSHPTGLATTFTTTLDRQDGKQEGRNEKGKGGKKGKDLSKIECYACGAMGHYANSCPYKNENKKSKSQDDDDEDEGMGHVTWIASTFTTYQVNSASDSRFKRTEILLDNQANVSIMHPDLLRNIMPAERSIKINGVGGHQFSVDESGYFDPFFQVFASEQTKANILSFAQVEDQYTITYKQKDCFIVHMPDRDIVFRRRDGMYVTDWTEYKDVFTTVVCTKGEQERAKKAYDLVRASGFPSLGEVIHLVEDGNIVNMPALTRDDVLRAYKLYGTPQHTYVES